MQLPQDCAGEVGGDAIIDNCGTCDNDVSNDCEQYNIELDGIDLVSLYALPEENSIENSINDQHQNHHTKSHAVHAGIFYSIKKA